jgi:protein O-mannosyl-transferase
MDAISSRLMTFKPLTFRVRFFLGIMIIIGTVLVVYMPSINGSFIFDDEKFLAENDEIRAADGLYRCWCTNETLEYYPLSYSTFWLQWRMWGERPCGYHATNVILHAAESLLIWTVLRRLSIPGAFLAALIFAVHPVNVESVAWIQQLRNLLAMLFFLLSTLWYLKFINRPRLRSAAESSPHLSSLIHRPSSIVSWYCLSLTAFVLAMLGKGSTAVLPVLLLGIIWWLGALTRRDLPRILPFFAIAIALSGANVWFQTKGTGEVFRDVGIVDRFLGAGSVVWFYLYKAILPVDLSLAYQQWHIQTGNLLWWMPLLAALAVTALFWEFRNGWSKPLLFAWGFFCAGLIPVMGFADVGFMQYSLVADHYQHISLISVAALAAASWGIWRRQKERAGRFPANAAAILAVCALTCVAYRQSGTYRNAIALYGATLEKNPECWMAHNNLGIALERAGQKQEAIMHFQRSMLINPSYAKAYYNLGLAIGREGRLDEGIEDLRQALHYDPNDCENYNGLGVLLAEKGLIQEAIEAYQRAVRLKPNNADVHSNLANAYASAGDNQQAVEQYKKAIGINPELPDAHNSLGLLLSLNGRPQEAIGYFSTALRLKPGYPEAQNNLGTVLAQLGRVYEAAERYKEALRLKPDYAEAHYNLANLFLEGNGLEKAIDEYRRALELSPHYAEAHNNLGLALVRSGQPAEAVAHYQEALKINPSYLAACCNLAYAYAQANQRPQAVAAAQKAMGLARSQGQTALAEQLEEWLKSYGDTNTKGASSPQPGEGGPPQAR